MAYFCTYCGKQLTENAKFCNNCGNEIKENKSEEDKKNRSVNKPNFSLKRQKVLSKNNTKPGNKKTVYSIISVLALMGFAAFYDSLPALANPVIEKQPVVVAEFKYPNLPKRMSATKATVRDGKIVIPFDALKKEKFLKFNYSSNNLNTPLLAYISEEGKVVTAVSMCEPCNSTTFHIRGDQLVCNSCGTTWELDNLNGLEGSCQKYPPDALPSIVVGNEIQIDESLVANWRRRI
ncbi:MAG: DUF2318 domain-containing protein [Calditrichaeota bacterium]|nr:DUF2318 domain-containing protein [Calditrichota bacterium]